MEVKSIFQRIRQSSREKDQEYFFAIQITEGYLRSAIWTLKNEEVEFLISGEIHPWANEKDLVEAVDTSLPTISQIKEPNKVIFGITPDWIEGNKIISQKQELLKKICHELDLSAIGFVVIPEALIYHLKIIEGVPPTAILVNRTKEKIFITLVKLGKIFGTQTISRGIDLGEDVSQGLKKFLPQEEIFPPRIIISDLSENLEEDKQQLINFNWEKEGIIFLHLPKIELLPSDFEIKSIALAGGREVGKTEGVAEVRIKKEEEKREEEKEELVPAPVEEEAVLLPSEEKKMMGFVKGKDVTEEGLTPQESLKKSPSSAEKITVNFPLKIKPPRLPQINIKLPFFHLGEFLRLFLGGKVFLKIGLITIPILILIGIMGALFWYLPKAEITLFIKPQILEKELSIKLSPSLKEIDKENLILPAEQEEVVLEKEKTISTTGTKIIGEPAKGEVTIYNRTSSVKTFKAGTEIITANNIKFTLDEDVTVASESAGTDYVKIPGKNQVKVTAVVIGSEGNLASGTEFAIANFSKSDYVAKNESAFSGGTSREVQVVAKKDQDKLVEDLTKELKDEALSQLKEKISAGKDLLEESLSFDLIGKNFDKKIDEEGETVRGTVKIKFKALTFSKEKFGELIRYIISGSVPKGFEFKSEQSESSFKLKEIAKDGSAVFLVNFKATLYPLLDLENIKESLRGKSPESGKAYLAVLPEIESFEVKLGPGFFPKKLLTFPRLAKNIKIEVKKK